MRALGRSLVHLECAVFLLATLTAVARADFPWPANGAPLCVAPGDQHGVARYPFTCGGMSVLWLDEGAVPARWQWSGVPLEPPSGSCPAPEPRLDAPGGRELALAGLFSLPLGMPGCQAPWPGSVWLQDSPASEELVGYFPSWTGHERVIVDDGAVTRQHPRLQGSANAFMDTAVVVVWSDDRGGVAQVRAQRVNWRGEREWGPHGILVAPTGEPQAEPCLSRLPDGSSLVVWLDERAGAHDVYALRLLPDGQAAPGWPPLGLALEARPEVATGLQVSGSLVGPTSYVIWEEQGPRFGGGRQVVARAVGATGLPDPVWDSQGVPLGDSPTVDRLQDVSPAGWGFVAVWTDTRAASAANPTDLYAQSLLGDGTRAPGWPAGGRAVCTAPGRQDHASVSGTFFAWEDSRGADVDVYALLLTAAGAIPCCEWVEDGLPAAVAPGDQTGPVAGAGNSGGGFVVWTDARDAMGNGLDVYAQAFTADGRNADTPGPRPQVARQLQAPMPNPARGPSRLSVSLASAGWLRLDVLDITGRLVRPLVDGWREAGEWGFDWDGRDHSGRVAPPGLYLARLRTERGEESRTILRIH